MVLESLSDRPVGLERRDHVMEIKVCEYVGDLADSELSTIVLRYVADGALRQGVLQSARDGVVCVLSVSGNDDEVGEDAVRALYHRGSLVAGVRS